MHDSMYQYTDFCIFAKKTMKYLWILSSLMLLAACNSKTTEDNSKKETRTTTPTDTLERLFEIGSETELAEIFGKENVAFDTVYGAEGEMSFATLLYPSTSNQVLITWKNMKKRKGMYRIEHTAWYDQDSERLLMDSRWKTEDGLALGTSMAKLVEANGKPLTFYGFGWDFGGTVSSFNKGTFEKKNMGIQLGISDFLNQGNDPNYLELMGDMEVNSDLPAAKELNPVIIAISFTKK